MEQFIFRPFCKSIENLPSKGKSTLTLDIDGTLSSKGEGVLVRKGIHLHRHKYNKTIIWVHHAFGIVCVMSSVEIQHLSSEGVLWYSGSYRCALNFNMGYNFTVSNNTIEPLRILEKV